MTGQRILAVTAVADPGGAEVALLRLLRELDGRGWEVELAGRAGGGVQARAAEAGWRFHHLPVGGLARRAGARAVASWPRARRLAARADVVYLNGTVAARLLPALRGARVVLHVHDVVERVPGFWRDADVVIAAAQAAADALPGLDARAMLGPVDPDPPPVEPPWAPGDRPVIGFVGRLDEYKAPLDLVRAAPGIRAGAPGARIVVVGDGPRSTYRRALDAEAEAAGVERHGWVDGAPGLMRHLDVLVAPSRREASLLVAAEAMAVGTPVVAARVGGVAETVVDGVTGALVEPGAGPDALAAAVLRVLERREELGAAAREHVRDFAVGPYADRVEALLAPAPGARA